MRRWFSLCHQVLPPALRWGPVAMWLQHSCPALKLTAACLGPGPAWTGLLLRGNDGKAPGLLGASQTGSRFRQRRLSAQRLCAAQESGCCGADCASVGWNSPLLFPLSLHLVVQVGLLCHSHREPSRGAVYPYLLSLPDLHKRQVKGMA